jgi:prepilin-type processing-associated H-X9-DG protein
MGAVNCQFLDGHAKIIPLTAVYNGTMTGTNGTTPNTPNGQYYYGAAKTGQSGTLGVQ